MTSAQPPAGTQSTSKVPAPDWQSLRQQVRTGERGLDFSTFNELWTFCQHVTKAAACPEHYRDKPNDLVMAIQFGAELGLTAMASMLNVVVIKGHASLMTNMMLGLCLRSPVFVAEAFEQRWEGTPYDDSYRAICTVQRKGAKPTVREFSVADAKRAKLWGKDNYNHYPNWMLMYRATSPALRTAFADVLLGLYSTEEMQVDRTIDALDLGDDEESDQGEMQGIREQLTKKPEPEPDPARPTGPPVNRPGEEGLDHLGLASETIPPEPETVAEAVPEPAVDEKAAGKEHPSYLKFMALWKRIPLAFRKLMVADEALALGFKLTDGAGVAKLPATDILRIIEAVEENVERNEIPLKAETPTQDAPV